MRGSLGEKIGEGATADIHAWAPGQVLKLFHARFSSSRLIRHEARVTRAVFAAGGPAPEVFDDVTVDGRFGFVLARHDGPTLLKLLRSGSVTPERAGAILATLMISAHKTAPPPEVRPLRDMIAAFMHANSAVPEPMAKGIHALIERLQPGDGLCHVDLHPQNVIMTAEGPRLVDWDLCGPRACRLRPRLLPSGTIRVRPDRRRRSEPATRHQCSLAVRVRAACRPVPRGADGGAGALPAAGPRLLFRHRGVPAPAAGADGRAH